MTNLTISRNDQHNTVPNGTYTDPTAGISDVLLMAAASPLHEASGRLLRALEAQTDIEIEAAAQALDEIRTSLRRAAELARATPEAKAATNAYTRRGGADVQ